MALTCQSSMTPDTPKTEDQSRLREYRLTWSDLERAVRLLVGVIIICNEALIRTEAQYPVLLIAAGFILGPEGLRLLRNQ